MTESFINVDGLEVDARIFTAKFCCDYEKCKGACCNLPMPGVELNGGALSDYDAAEILYHRKSLSLLCDEEDRHLAVERPVSKIGGEFFTTLHRDKCVFCSMQKGICVLKIAKEKKIADIDIPLSCQLYPILWEVYPDYERLIIGDTFDKGYCEHGYIKGEHEDIFLLDFLKTPLVRGLGEEFYSKLKLLQRNFL